MEMWVENKRMLFLKKSNVRFFQKQAVFFKKQPVFFRIPYVLVFQRVSKWEKNGKNEQKNGVRRKEKPKNFSPLKNNY